MQTGRERSSGWRRHAGYVLKNTVPGISVSPLGWATVCYQFILGPFVIKSVSSVCYHVLSKYYLCINICIMQNGSMHPDVPASTFWWCSSPVACAQQAVHRYCLNLRPSGAECPHTRNPVGHVQGWPVPALSRQEEGQYDPHRVDWMDHLLGSTSSRRGSRGFFLQLRQITDSEIAYSQLYNR